MYIPCIYVGISSSENEDEEQNLVSSTYINQQGKALCRYLDGEQILFQESEGEESDWIDSDLEETTIDDSVHIEGAADLEVDRRNGPIDSKVLTECIYMYMYSTLYMYMCTHSACNMSFHVCYAY